jgi:hypothetical protein
MEKKKLENNSLLHFFISSFLSFFHCSSFFVFLSFFSTSFFPLPQVEKLNFNANGNLAPSLVIIKQRNCLERGEKTRRRRGNGRGGGEGERRESCARIVLAACFLRFAREWKKARERGEREDRRGWRGEKNGCFFSRFFFFVFRKGRKKRYLVTNVIAEQSFYAQIGGENIQNQVDAIQPTEYCQSLLRKNNEKKAN